MAEIPTTCRICESACGLLADIRSDGSVSLAPDPADPHSRGFACVKGTRFGQHVQHHPDRLSRPWVDGREVTWDEAMTTIRSRWRASIERHGLQSAAIYSGNAMAHSLGGVLAVSSLQRALRTPRHYSCLTLDNSEMFVVAEQVFGAPMTTFVADYDNTDLLVLLGTDPLSSQPSQAQSQPRAGHVIRDRARAGQLVVIDPRRSQTARTADTHLQPRPGSDVFLLAWLVRRVIESGRSVRPLDEQRALAQATLGFDRTRVADQTGLSEQQLDRLAARWLGARRPLVWSGLGVLLSEHGTLGWWLTLTLQVLTVGLDNPGGWRWRPGPLSLPRWLSRFGPPGRDPNVRARSGHPAILGTLAAATLPDTILSDEAPIRSLVVFGGDPLNALPDTERARAALESLDLLISVDLFRRGTAAMADVVLPAASWLERDELAVHIDHQRPVSHLRLDRAVLAPGDDVRSDWAIAVALGECIGRGPFGLPMSGRSIYRRFTPTGLAQLACKLARIRIPGIGNRPDGDSPNRQQPLPEAQLAVEELCRALAALPDRPRALRLVTSVRPSAKMNHWLGGPVPSTAWVHPELGPEGPGRLVGPAGAMQVELRHDPALRPDVVVVPFGAGPGNPNHVIARDALEAFTGQPISNGTVVHLDTAID